MGPHVSLGEQPRDPVSEHARLARARARDHENRPIGMGHGFALAVVEAGQQVVVADRGRHPRRVPAGVVEAEPRYRDDRMPGEPGGRLTAET